MWQKCRDYDGMGRAIRSRMTIDPRICARRGLRTDKRTSCTRYERRIPPQLHPRQQRDVLCSTCNTQPSVKRGQVCTAQHNCNLRTTRGGYRRNVNRHCNQLINKAQQIDRSTYSVICTRTARRIANKISRRIPSCNSRSITKPMCSRAGSSSLNRVTKRTVTCGVAKPLPCSSMTTVTRSQI